MADAEDGQDDRPHWRLCLGIQEHKEAAANGGDHPSAPDGPSVAPSAGGSQRDNDAAGEKEAGDGKDVQPCLGGLLKPNRSEIEGDVVEGTEELLHVSKGQLASREKERTMKPWNKAQAYVARADVERNREGRRNGSGAP